jgi:Domain of unknown function (DUF2382)
MSRTVAALYDSRAEAELARARLISQFQARSPRIIAKDTAAAVDGLAIARDDAAYYREGLRGGAHLLVAEVPSRANPKAIVELLAGSSADDVDASMDRPQPDVRRDLSAEKLVPARRRGDPETPLESPGQPSGHSELASDAAAEPSPFAQANERLAPAPEPLPRAASADGGSAQAQSGQDVRVGPRAVARAGARAFTSEVPAEEQISLREDVVEIENRPSERPLTESEIEAGGLFKDRVFEITEMREEPVVTKVAIVREEVIVRKSVRDRTETVRDTVRRTDVEVEDLSDEPSSAFFGQDSTARSPGV